MENNINSIAVFGDSILKGAVTGTESGHLFDIIENSSLNLAQQKLGFEMNNQSVFGNIITKAQRKLNKMIERGERFDLGIIESGGNDCDYDWAVVSEDITKEHSPRVTLEDYIRIIDEMVTLLRTNKITPLIMTMPPLVPDRWFNHISRDLNKENILKFLSNNPYKLYQNHELYNNALLKYSYEHNVQIVDMREAMLLHDNYRNLMCMDGIHPNEDGYRYMSEVWIRALPKVQREFPVEEEEKKTNSENIEATEEKTSDASCDNSSSEDKIIIYTDGGCRGNPGPGGWGVVIIADGVAKQLSGGEEHTTNNRMELTAALNALTAVRNTPRFNGKKIEVNIDSQYVRNGITSWIKSWKQKGWLTAEKKPVKNVDLWVALDALATELDITWNWVKGHAGVTFNEVCDDLCNNEMDKLQK